jgi:Protein of unknown function (DUF2612)
MADVPTTLPSVLAPQRVVSQYADKPKFMAYLAALTAMLDGIYQAALSLYTLPDIDASEGVQLDNIGALVGQPRSLRAAVPKSFFGFSIEGPGSFPQPLPYGEEGATPNYGGVLWDEGSALADSAAMDDATYRRAIKARIVYNDVRPSATTGWKDAIYAVLFQIFPGFDGVTVHVDGGMAIEIGLRCVPSAQQKALLLYADLLPVPACVSWTVLVWDPTVPVFGFDDTIPSYGDTIAGYAEEPATTGGVLAEEE